MFTRFTPVTRTAVASAAKQAQREGAREIREEHLLDSLLDSREGTRLLAVIASAAERDKVRDEIGQTRRKGGLTSAEASALAA